MFMSKSWDVSHMRSAPLDFDSLHAALRAAGEGTRLRVLALLAEADLTVSDLTKILRQSQPRISRHLKLLAEAGPVVLRDRGRLAAVRAARAAAAQTYFSQHAAEWDRIRRLHVTDAAVEGAIQTALADRPIRALLDLGTGTGRMLELFGADIERGLGVDMSLDMLALARARLERAGLKHCSVRQGDIYELPVPKDSFDVVLIHQVLHFLDDGGRAVAEAARALRPQGRLLVVDFAPHDLEFLREEHAHLRLGFTPETVEQWMKAAGLDVALHRTLPPEPGSDGKIAVSLWLARDPRLALVSSAQEVA